MCVKIFMDMEQKNKTQFVAIGLIVGTIIVFALTIFCIVKQQFQILTGFACGALIIWGLLSILSQKYSDCIVAINIEDTKDALAYVLKHRRGTSEMFINLFGKKVYDYFLRNNIITVTSEAIDGCAVWEVTSKAIEVYNNRINSDLAE